LSPQGKNFQFLIRLGRIQPLTQSRHGALSNLQKKLPELACLGRRRLIVIQNELLIWNYKGTAEDHFRASLVKFGGC